MFLSFILDLFVDVFRLWYVNTKFTFDVRYGRRAQLDTYKICIWKSVSSDSLIKIIIMIRNKEYQYTARLIHSVATETAGYASAS